MLKRFVLILALSVLVGCASARPGAGPIHLINTLQLHDQLEFKPTPKPIQGDSHAHYWDPLVAYAESLGARVFLVDMDELFPEYATGDFEILGYYTGIDHPRFADKLILINHTLTGNRRVATLLHEIGHLVSPGHINDATGDHDVWSEAFAVLVAKGIGLDIHQNSFAYLSSFRNRYAVLNYYSVPLDNAVQALLAALR